MKKLILILLLFVSGILFGQDGNTIKRSSNVEGSETILRWETKAALDAYVPTGRKQYRVGIVGDSIYFYHGTSWAAIASTLDGLPNAILFYGSDRMPKYSNNLKWYENGSGSTFQSGHGTISEVGNFSNLMMSGTLSSPNHIGDNSYLSGIIGYDNDIDSNSIASYIFSQHSNVKGGHNLSAGGSSHNVGNYNDYNVCLGGTMLDATGGYSFAGGGIGGQALGLRSTSLGNTFSTTKGISTLSAANRYSTIDSLCQGAVQIGCNTSTIDDLGPNKSENAVQIGAAFGSITNGDYSVSIGGFNPKIGHRFAITLGGRDLESLGEYSLASGRRSKSNVYGSNTFSDGQNVDAVNNTVNGMMMRFAGGYKFDGGMATFQGNIKTSFIVDETGSTGSIGQTLTRTATGMVWQ